MSLEELRDSMLVEGPEEGYPNWDSGWRMKLVENLEVMVGQSAGRDSGDLCRRVFRRG
jgi:hypothetical protein